MQNIKNKFSGYNLNTKCNELTGKYDACMAIPYGKKCYLWFTYFENSPQCFLIETNHHKEVTFLRKIILQFNFSLCKGTILYGTILTKNIIIEDVCFFENKYVLLDSFFKKCIYFKHIMKNIKYHHMNTINPCLAVIKHTYDEIIKMKNSLPYDIYCVKFYNMQYNYFKILLSKNNKILVKKTQTFIIRKTQKTELYELFEEKNNQYIFSDFAQVSTIHTSKMLESAFLSFDKNVLKCKCVLDTENKEWLPIAIYN